MSGFRLRVYVISLQLVLIFMIRYVLFYGENLGGKNTTKNPEKKMLFFFLILLWATPHFYSTNSDISVLHLLDRKEERGCYSTTN